MGRAAPRPYVDALLTTAVAQRALLPGAVNENPSHRLGCGGKEMRAIFESRRVVANEPQPCFVDQGGGLKGVPGCFMGHLARGKPPQFFIDQRQQLAGGFSIAAFDGAENLRRLAHACQGPLEADRLATIEGIVNAIKR